MWKKRIFPFAPLLGSIFLAVLLQTSLAPARENSFPAGKCKDCHGYRAATIGQHGGKHKSELACADCHREHPPEGTDTIAACSDCHGGKSHYELESCLNCHTDPHKPLLSIEFPLSARKECTTCHTSQGGDFANPANRHSVHVCTFCHMSHDDVPTCLECHDRHIPEQGQKDCLQCHPPHRPNLVVFREFTPISYCQPCHAGVIGKHGRSTAKHSTLACTYCHNGLHPMSPPSCEECHGLAHGWRYQRKYKTCVGCHQDPHFLI